MDTSLSTRTEQPIPTVAGRAARRAGDADSAAPMPLSIIIPILDEAENIAPLHARLKEVLNAMDRDHEILFINDGSTDGSAELLDAIAEKDAAVKAIHLRRNYGQTAAIMAGIEASRGDILVPMDGDLQNDPKDIPRLVEKIGEGFDVVSGWRKNRKEAFLVRRLPSMVANWLISTTFGVVLHDYGCTLKAYRRHVIENVRLYGEMHRFIPVYAAWEGARVTELPVTHHARVHGKSKYGLGRVTAVLLDLVVLYFLGQALDRPIQFFGKIGILCLALSMAAFIGALFLMGVQGVSLIQTPLPLLAATLGLSGILFVLLGVMAEILSRTYFSVLGNKSYIVKAVRQRKTDAAPSRAADKAD
jgi:glycosyltransferase involved in cell wall biosynthesis